MKNYRRTKVINRFSAISTSFRAEFNRQVVPRVRPNLTLSTVLSRKDNADETTWLESLLEIWHQGAMVFNRSSEVVQATEFTEKMLQKYFPKGEKDSNGVPTELANWMKLYRFTRNKSGIEMTSEPFAVEADGDELIIRLIVDSLARRKTLLLKETVQIQPDSLMVLGLTKRESEVLFLIAQGKTNPEIGMLLDISTRTVQKHVEHIYVKLGIETRTAAMLRVNELNSSMVAKDISTTDA